MNIIITKAELAGRIDHTLLKPESTHLDIAELCRQARENNFKTVCVNPCFVSAAAAQLAGSQVGVGTVIGFPLGANDPSIKAAEAITAVRAGATELDVVINIGFLKGGQLSEAYSDLTGVIRAARQEESGIVVKVILETCLLNEAEKAEACRLAVSAGADYVKTSTGFAKGGATVSDVALLRKTAGPGIGIKAAGGIRDLNKALQMIEAGADRIGTSSGLSIIKELAGYRL
ncbi:deoxyribose-phosphate aldolase [Pelotomaculum propionicicum]|mgnify:CR=1 FL=1|uniref:Deoxyribose-phosphate aldolase n=1 Tax=Pelotomaculum propionicicum TaxID=258475 RepID=A0A4Y7RNV5_9FIRM|nr:deoxyribose-phosphate aldolase [Pelotomaculum propionicicum]NLI13684.1 deoxyribose-phosphate aldolase [Peptococcaceae bacterium]TEB09997.1 Deoxyribose-phosphate aldolase [Pelotomaculum propionicicum]